MEEDTMSEIFLTSTDKKIRVYSNDGTVQAGILTRVDTHWLVLKVSGKADDDQFDNVSVRNITKWQLVL